MSKPLLENYFYQKRLYLEPPGSCLSKKSDRCNLMSYPGQSVVSIIIDDMLRCASLLVFIIIRVCQRNSIIKHPESYLL